MNDKKKITGAWIGATFEELAHECNTKGREIEQLRETVRVVQRHNANMKEAIYEELGKETFWRLYHKANDKAVD